MTMTQPTAIQMAPFSAYLEEQLERRFRIIRWHDLTPAEQQAALDGADETLCAVVTNGHVGCPDALLTGLPGLKIVAIHGVGFDKVNRPLAREKGISVTTTPNVLNEDVADLAIGLIISLLRSIAPADAFVRAGTWEQAEYPLANKVTGRRFGIVGLGSIGAEIARRLTAFGPVAYTGTAPKQVPYDYHPDALSLARASDVLIVACPSNAATHHLIDEAILDALGPQGYVVNIARGAVIDEAALITALDQRRIAGAALDVFEHEPHVPEALWASPHVLLTPHIASATEETRRDMADMVLANLDAMLAGAPPPHALA
ncbi:MAG: 2-hydroxyacid dehydrogenase [Sphingobium sp.]